MFIIKEIVKKIIHKLGWTASIDWPAIVRDMGADSVYDSRTLENDKNQTTKDQAKLYDDLINKELCSSKVSKVLDYGCGIGRHYEFLCSLNSLDHDAEIIGFDTKLEFFWHSYPGGGSK